MIGVGCAVVSRESSAATMLSYESIRYGVQGVRDARTQSVTLITAVRPKISGLAV